MVVAIVEGKERTLVETGITKIKDTKNNRVVVTN
jgi:hypothetical protein